MRWTRIRSVRLVVASLLMAMAASAQGAGAQAHRLLQLRLHGRIRGQRLHVADRLVEFRRTLEAA